MVRPSPPAVSTRRYYNSNTRGQAPRRGGGCCRQTIKTKTKNAPDAGCSGLSLCGWVLVSSSSSSSSSSSASSSASSALFTPSSYSSCLFVSSLTKTSTFQVAADSKEDVGEARDPRPSSKAWTRAVTAHHRRVWVLRKNAVKINTGPAKTSTPKSRLLIQQ